MNVKDLKIFSQVFTLGSDVLCKIVRDEDRCLCGLGCPFHIEWRDGCRCCLFDSKLIYNDIGIDICCQDCLSYKNLLSDE